jgi:CheY-like chemotaxis protein
MPKMDGKQVIKYARMKYPDNRFPIIAVSGTVIEQMDKLDEIGADYYIAKGPMENMADNIAKCIERIDKYPFPSQYEDRLIDFENMFPRQPTSGLIEVMNFQWAIIESMGVGIIVVDKDTRVININLLALDIIDKSIEGVLNCYVTALFPKEERPVIVDALKRVIHNQELRKTAFSIFISSRDIRMIVSALKIDGEIAGWIIALETINVSEI